MKEIVIANAIAHPELRVWAKLAAKYVETEISLEHKQFDLQAKQQEARIQELEAKLASLSVKSSAVSLSAQALEEKSSSSHATEELKSAAVKQLSDVAGVGLLPKVAPVEETKPVVPQVVELSCSCGSSCKTLATTSSSSASSIDSTTKSNKEDAGVSKTS